MGAGTVCEEEMEPKDGDNWMLEGRRKRKSFLLPCVRKVIAALRGNMCVGDVKISHPTLNL